jgi:hypothetical protein
MASAEVANTSNVAGHSDRRSWERHWDDSAVGVGAILRRGVVAFALPLTAGSAAQLIRALTVIRKVEQINRLSVVGDGPTGLAAESNCLHNRFCVG